MCRIRFRSVPDGAFAPRRFPCAALPGSRFVALAALLASGFLLAPARAVAGMPADWFPSTARVKKPLQPFSALPPGSVGRMRAAVVSMPDPVETRLARAFDIELAALLSAFQTHDYVLDSFAFSWDPRASARQIEPGSDDARLENRARDLPSLLLLRKDDWREDDWPEDDWREDDRREDDRQEGAGGASEYFALFLIGETPTSGVHPEAFKRAARCAIALNRGLSEAHWGANCDEVPAPAGDARLEIIGPAFSGSMESFAAQIANLQRDPSTAAEPLDVLLLTPSATVGSNERIDRHPLVWQRGDVRIHYRAIAPPLKDQLARVFTYLAASLGARPESDPIRVVLLAEESIFGAGAVQSGRGWHGISLVPVQFPPNIAAIRAEHADVDRKADAERRQLLPRHLLELDLRGVEQRRDLPPVYQPSLSARSDELLLYRTFDALGTWVDPNAVIIVATDVRDRLFLLREVRRALPGTLRVVLEEDALLVHPDYRGVDRGTLVVPAGDTLVRLDEAAKLVHAPPGRTRGERYFPFATDYAANTFRAGVLLLTDYANNQLPKRADPEEPMLLVATLAGFQSVDATAAKNGATRARNLLIAADIRLELQRPLYIGLVVLGLAAMWLAVRLLFLEPGGRVLQPLLRMLFHPVSLRARETDAGQPEPMLRRQPILAGLVLGLASVTTLIAGWRLSLFWYCGRLDPCFANDTFDLAHGRDAWALTCLLLALSCAAIFTRARVAAWNRRCEDYALEGKTFRTAQIGNHGGWLSLALAVVFAVSAGAYVAVPTLGGVDTPRLSAVAGMAVLGVGVFFLAQLWMQLARWQRLTRALARVIRSVNREGHLEGWPAPELLEEPPSSPFHIVVTDSDLAALRRSDAMKWLHATGELMDGRWPFGVLGDGLQDWQTRLVAEMKVASVAVRSTAWCAVLAPAVALAALQVYPPAAERMQVAAAIALLSLAFASLLVGALLLEKDRLLGRMFTRDQDRLSLRTAFAVIGPKLLAFAVLLAASSLPEVWDWLHGTIQALGVLGHWGS